MDFDREDMKGDIADRDPEHTGITEAQAMDIAADDPELVTTEHMLKAQTAMTTAHQPGAADHALPPRMAYLERRMYQGQSRAEALITSQSTRLDILENSMQKQTEATIAKMKNLEAMLEQETKSREHDKQSTMAALAAIDERLRQVEAGAALGPRSREQARGETEEAELPRPKRVEGGWQHVAMMLGSRTPSVTAQERINKCKYCCKNCVGKHLEPWAPQGSSIIKARFEPETAMRRNICNISRAIELEADEL